MTSALALLAVTASMNALPKPVATPFPLADVKLLGGPFEKSHEATAKYLLELDPERLLAGFRINSGLKPKAEIYGGWETGGLSGHSLGHYLTACAQEYAHTKDPRYKAKIDAIVAGLVECQKSRPDGFISAFRFDNGFDRARIDKIWQDVSEGKLRSGGFDLNGMWSPWYVHHKVFAGLLDAQEMCGNKQAMGVAEKFADWTFNITKNLTPEQWQQMLGTEYGGINESFAEMYRRTKKEKYLDLARKFYDKRVLDPLAEGRDELSNKHSNTQIPKLIGLARLYETTGDTRDRKAAEFFWSTVVNHHTYVIGGNSNGEYLGPPDKLNDRLSTNTCETCNTYNMLKLTRHLFEWNPQASQFDFYERAYLNHILASQDPATGMVTYFVPLATGSARNYSNPYNDFTCCHGSGMENHTKHGDSAYFHDGGKTLWVNLFMPTTLNFRDAGVKLTQQTAFPEANAVSISIDESKGKEFDLKVRHPGWAKSPIEFKVNGKTVATSSTPSSYVSIKRKWAKGDKLEFALPMTLHTEAMPDNPKRVAALYGPVVLAANMGPVEGGRRRGNNSVPGERTPVLVTNDRPVAEWLSPVAGKSLTFKTADAARPEDLVFAPFYSLYRSRYGVYFDKFTAEEWSTREAEYRAEEARLKDLAERTIDQMTIGQMQPERDHNLTQERNDVREANDRSFRTPLVGGWFEFEMKVGPATELVMSYWGNDRIRPDYAILVDGKEIAAETLAGRPANKFFDVTYAIPAELLAGKTSVKVRIQPREGKSGPSVCGARTIRAK